MSAPRPWERHYPPSLAWDLSPPVRPLNDMLSEAAAAFADRIVIQYNAAEISYAALAEAVAETSAGLMVGGVKPGDKVALYLPNTPYHPFAFFGTLKAGGVVVHLSPLDAERELAHKLTDSGARILVTTNIGMMLPMAQRLLAAGLLDRIIVGDDKAFGTIPGLPVLSIPTDDPRIIDFASLREMGRNSSPVWPVVDPHALAVLQYTGGTTGLPKGAMHSNASLGASVASYDAFYEAQNDDEAPHIVICVLPLFHIYALVVLLLWQIKRGSTLLLRLRFDIPTVLHDIEVRRATYFPGVPTMWIALNNVPDIDKRDFSSLRQVGSGGAPLPVEVAQRFEALVGKRIGGGWGMTETASAGTANLMNGLFKEGTIGMPLPGIDVQIVSLDDPRRVLGFGEIGEMRVKAANIFQGYYNKAEETAKSFVDGYFLTGDVGSMDEDGLIILVDRRKDMIISGGFNVYPRIIEDAIYEHPAVEEVIVIGIEDEYRGQAAKAFIKLRAGEVEFKLDSLQAFLADKIGKHEMPTALEFRDALPKTSVGKLSKKELVEDERRKPQIVKNLEQKNG
ncbi:MAG TPA: AMP-binding protein [Acetobacteraceae bacterium]|nr:AMP-binding protein [Acetobacteraceae bacterium]